jgi:ABC-type dipeptide/oligopeptide/nickel transport system permease component
LEFPVILRIFVRGTAILILSGLVGATLVRLAPGFGTNEEALDPRLSAQSQKALQERNGPDNPLLFYEQFLGRLLRGDLGQSVIFSQSVGALVRERAPTTLQAVSGGLAIGWIGAILLASAAVLIHRPPTVLIGMGLSSILLSIPSAVLATVCLLLRLAPSIAIAAVIFPRVFPHAYEQLRSSMRAPYVLMARARGIAGIRLFLFHVSPPTLLPMAALAGVSITLALGASIPIEALADSPGLGQLAWRSALGRDLQVLVIVTLLLTAVTVVVNTLADLLLLGFGERTR